MQRDKADEIKKDAPCLETAEDIEEEMIRLKLETYILWEYMQIIYMDGIMTGEEKEKILKEIKDEIESIGKRLEELKKCFIINEENE